MFAPNKPAITQIKSVAESNDAKRQGGIESMAEEKHARKVV